MPPLTYSIILLRPMPTIFHTLPPAADARHVLCVSPGGLTSSEPWCQLSPPLERFTCGGGWVMLRYGLKPSTGFAGSGAFWEVLAKSAARPPLLQMIYPIRLWKPKLGVLPQFIIKRLRPNIIEAEELTGSAEGEVVLIPRTLFVPSDTGLRFKLIRQQFPVMPALAMTINKSQGQTLDRVGIFLPEPVFAIKDEIDLSVKALYSKYKEIISTLIKEKHAN
ncbi:hypothetical protein QTO34_019351 [Cnephaeus nilssonii]|uniref:Uncharacterized protein n=1 Tax=Cnephaeus nilssonii TaxID=3371016 RepID=A0AA40HWI8_CNENI|nr:hypothetical protein QTO34_019351 [Eptesicus nilssonii]